MGYVPSVASDEKEHRTYHDRVVHGVLARPLKTDRLIWQESDRRISVVTADAPLAQRYRAEAAAFVANLETSYNGGIYHACEPRNDREKHLFLYHNRNRISGLAILEKRGTVWCCRWRESIGTECEILTDHDPMWSVVFVWVHGKYRKHGIARQLLAEGLKHMGLSLQDIGWYTPFTDSGTAFVKSMCLDKFYVAK